MTDSFETALRAIAGAAGWVDMQDASRYLTEWRGDYTSEARAVVRPADRDQLIAIVRLCAQHKVSMVPQGGNTGLSGAAVARADQIIVSLERLSAIQPVRTLDASVVVEAGATLQDIQEAASAAGLYFPLQLSSAGSCQIGGNLSTNAGGVNFLRYGGARDQVLGLEVVLADGQLINNLGTVRKDNSGYDWKHWFIGAEGTLGFITAASLKLVPAPQKRIVCWLGFERVELLMRWFLKARDAFPNTLAAFELISARAIRFVCRHLANTRAPFAQNYAWHVLMELHGGAHEIDDEAVQQIMADAIQDGLVADAVLAQSARQAEALWQLRHTISEAQRHEGVSLKHDIALPISAIAEFIEMNQSELHAICPDLRPVCFGHVGDGNLHYNISQPAAMEAADFRALAGEISACIHDAVLRAGGSISAEHGIGLKKKALLREQVGESALALMARLKRSLDPDNLMNPGKIL